MESSSPKILVVDDEPFIRDVLVRILGREGYSCRQVPGAAQALAALEETEFDLMISDIRMPGMDGMELLRTVRRDRPDIAVIMVTAVEDRTTAIEALGLGAFGYVIKPFDLTEMAIHVASAIERRRLTLLSRATQERLEEEVRRRTAEIRSREEEIALRLVAAAEYRDTDTGAHVRRIGLYSARLAEILGWPAAEVDDLRVAAMMHDVGKIGVPDSILLKPGPLSEEEFAAIRLHTVIGAGILASSDVPLLRMAREIALRHHERWDGSGYPDGMLGEAIPPAARIVAVVDVYDALVHDRVYRAALPEDQVVAELLAGRGRHFEPAALDAFLANLADFRRIRETVVGVPSGEVPRLR